MMSSELFRELAGHHTRSIFGREDSPKDVPQLSSRAQTYLESHLRPPCLALPMLVGAAGSILITSGAAANRKDDAEDT